MTFVINRSQLLLHVCDIVAKYLYWWSALFKTDHNPSTQIVVYIFFQSYALAHAFVSVRFVFLLFLCRKTHVVMLCPSIPNNEACVWSLLNAARCPKVVYILVLRTLVENNPIRSYTYHVFYFHSSIFFLEKRTG